MVEDIVIDKNKGKKQTASKTTQKSDSQVTDLEIYLVQLPAFATFNISLYICRFSVPEKFFI